MQHAMPTPHDWQEGRRLRGWVLARKGWTQQAIAEALGVTQGAVSQWLSRARAGGITALRRRRAPGPRPKLSAAQRDALPALLVRGPEAFGFRGDVWTTKRVTALIAVRFGVRYHPAHVSRLLRAIDWSPQRPIQRATQRDEAAVARWYAERWPALKKRSYARVKPCAGAGLEACRVVGCARPE
jgi:transposase